MKRAFLYLALLIALLAPAFGQRGRQLSADDQRRFDSYYSRWENYRSSNNQSEMRSMEKRMQDIYQHYGIPANTPYREIAAGAGGRDWDRDRDQDRDWDQNRRAEWERYRDRDRAYYQQNQRLSADDQHRFDSYFSRWENYRHTNNRDQVASMEKRMYDVYDHYGIPRNVPFDRVASR